MQAYYTPTDSYGDDYDDYWCPEPEVFAMVFAIYQENSSASSSSSG